MEKELPLKIKTYIGKEKGTSLLILGCVHGNEVCGKIAIEKVINEIENGLINVISGEVIFVPIVNLEAYIQNRRFIERDLNRGFMAYKSKILLEDKIQLQIAKLMKKCDVLLDIHSFRATGDAFVFVGPENNKGNIEPFDKSDKELEFAKCLGVQTMVFGWVQAYFNYIESKQHFEPKNKKESPNEFDFGKGTTEYFRSLKKYGVTVECGNHLDSNSINVAYTAIINSLSFLGIINKIAENNSLKTFKNSYKFTEILFKKNEDDKLSKNWCSFEKVSKGEVLAKRATGEIIRAKSNGIVIFSYPDSKIGKEWLYFAEESNRGK